jgi:chemotaxis protein MotB
MAGDAKKLQPIIVKRIKKGGHGAHGGAWKIAYADFVTAMMAFFLLMWLLGSTTEGDRKGLQDYFNSPLKVAMSGGSGSGDSSSVIKGGRGPHPHRRPGQARRGGSPKRTFNLQALKAEQARAEAAKLMELQNNLQERIAASEKFKALSSQLKMDMTRDGLRIQIVDARTGPCSTPAARWSNPTCATCCAPSARCWPVPNLLTLEATPTPPLLRQRAGVQQLGALRGPGQCLAARADRRRPGETASCGCRAGLQPAVQPKDRTTRPTAASRSS